MEQEKRAATGDDRTDLLAELAELRKTHSGLAEKLRVYEKCDPKRVDELKAKLKVCREGMTRWTDNLYEVEMWIKKSNPALSTGEIHDNFPILRDLDYAP